MVSHSSGSSFGSDRKTKFECVCISVQMKHVFIFICVLLRFVKPGVETAAHKYFYSRWCLHNEYTMSLGSTPCLNACKQQATQVLYTYLSLLLSLQQLPVTCILWFKAVNLFIFSARHTAFNLWWRNWSRRQNVPILWLHKTDLFFI